MKLRKPTRAVATRFALVGVAVACLFGMACSAPPVEAGHATVTNCETVPTREPDFCHTLTVDGRVVRYALSESTSGSSETILVDYGGPGLSSLTTDGLSRVRRYLDSTLHDHRLLLIEEPWVTSEMSERCRNSGAAFLDELGASNQPVGGIGDCAPVGLAWNAETYVAAVEAVTFHEGLMLDGFVGAPFAATRLACLYNSDVLPRWAAIVSPLPSSLALADILNYQAERVIESSESLNVVLGAVATSENPRDRIAALIQLSQDASERDLGALTADDIQQAANSYTGFYGTGSMSPGRIAYLLELCGSMRAANLPFWDGSASDVVGFMGAFHSGCGTSDEVVDGFTLQKTPSDIEMCVVLAKDEPLIPYELLKRYYTSHPEVSVIEITTSSHGDLALLSFC